MIVWRRLAAIVAEHGSAALVTVQSAQGSTPREAGARMIVRPDGAFHGSIGGGQLEWQALAAAREALAGGRGPARALDKVLGPDLGQCCGGRVTLMIETFDPRDSERLAALAAGEQESRTPLLLFGAGHVGRALVLALAPLPFAVRWIDSRAGAFPPHVPANTTPALTGNPEGELAAAEPGSFVLVMTHEHPLDLAIAAAALRRDDLPYIGLIGSATKRARFEKRFRAIGIPEERVRALVCPIGVPGIAGKDPPVIAASVAAQLLAERECLPAALTSRSLGGGLTAVA